MAIITATRSDYEPVQIFINASAIKLGISTRPCCSTRSSRKLARCSQSDLTTVLVDFSVCRTQFPAVYLSGGPLVLSDRLSSLLSGIPASSGNVSSGRGGGGGTTAKSSVSSNSVSLTLPMSVVVNMFHSLNTRQRT